LFLPRVISKKISAKRTKRGWDRRWSNVRSTTHFRWYLQTYLSP